MSEKKSFETINDFVTGKEVPNIGSEVNRQTVERFLVEDKGFLKEDINVDVDIEISVTGDVYRSQVDLVVSVGKKKFMAIKCAAGSLGSREREIVAASRLLGKYQIPYAIVSDGKTAIVLDTVSGQKVGTGLDAIPSRNGAVAALKILESLPLTEDRREREKLIFRTYDDMTVNVQRKLKV